MYERNGKKKQVATIVCIAIIALLVVFVDQTKTKNAMSAASTEIVGATATPSAQSTIVTTATTPATPTPPATNSGSASSYKDGTYTATSSYYVPHGSETIQVDLTIKNGVITTSSIANSEGDHESAQYQEDFASVYRPHVVGHSISGLQLDTIAGASDTTQGFNDALSQILTQAQA